MKVSREVKTAILVLSGIALFIYLFTFLQGEDLFTKTDTYYTEFDYNALSMSSSVTIRGNRVGKVEDIQYDFKTRKTRVTFSVNPQLEFSKNSIVRLYETGLMGGNALAIVDANDGENAKPGDFIMSEVQPGLISSLKKNFTGLSADLDNTIRTADTLMTNINKMVVDESNEGIQATIAELNSTLRSFKSLSNTLEGTVKKNEDKIEALLDNFETTSSNLNALSIELKEAGFSKTIDNFNNTLIALQETLAKVGSNEGTIGKLLNDNALYNNLEAATKELNLLLLDIKLNPARYRRILSKKEIPYKKPTEDQMN